jgi:hypothetical protein
MNLNESYGVIVVDSRNSPLWRAATSHAENRNLEVFCADEYFSPHGLSQAIRNSGCHFVIFSWRGGLDGVLNSCSARKGLSSSKIYIFLLIPDLIGLHKISVKELKRIQSVDCLLVTSKQLFEGYSKSYDCEQVMLLRDYPPFGLITEVKNLNLKRNPNQVIWVGNSEWGQRSGFKDHKGLNRFARPVMEIVSKKAPGVEFVVIDSAITKMPYVDVLREIARSSCLIMTSDSEGTGLPILEAAFLGTPVVSLDVGIASDLLSGELSDQVSPKNIETFAEKVEETLIRSNSLSKMFLDFSGEYKARVLLDFEKLSFDETRHGTWRTRAITIDITARMKWKYRWIRYRFTNLFVS